MNETNEQQEERLEESGGPAAGGPGEGSRAGERSEGGMEDPMAALRAERDGLFARLARVSADYQNYMKRMESKVGEAAGLAKGDVLRRFIPVLDQMEAALKSEAKSEEGKAMHSGLRIVRDELVKVLEQSGVKRVEPAVGEPFDPHLHEAMMRVRAEGVEPGCVAAVLTPGYVLGERTLRAAQVAVASE